MWEAVQSDPQLYLRNCMHIVDALRLHNDERELVLVHVAARLAALGDLYIDSLAIVYDAIEAYVVSFPTRRVVGCDFVC